MRLDDVDVDVQVDAAPPQTRSDVSRAPAAPPVPRLRRQSPRRPFLRWQLPCPRTQRLRCAPLPRGDVLFEAPVPLPVPAVQPLPANFELARKFNFAFDANQSVCRRGSRTVSAPTLAGGGSEATLKLEGEYWDLKAARLEEEGRRDPTQGRYRRNNWFQNGQGEIGI